MANNSEYWRKRFEALEEASNNISTEYLNRLEKDFDKAIAKINRDIMVWYDRLSINNEVNLTRAKEMLSNKELKEFLWTVEEYIKYGEKNAITQEWLKELENASAKAHIERLEAIKLQMRHEVEVLTKAFEDGLTKTLSTIYEESYLHTGYEIEKGLNVGKNLASINNSTVDKAIKRPWAMDKQNFSTRIWKNKEKLISTLNTNLTQSIIRGEDPQKAIDHITKAMGTSKKNAGRLVMTESAFVTSSAQIECYKELGVEEFEIVATLDTRTSETCRKLDGTHLPIEEYEPGVTAPPFHCRCRTCTAPYYDDEFTVGEERAYRDVDGKTQYVKKMTYNEWYEKYVKPDPEYSFKEKAEKNRLSDQRQYENYVKVLGKDYIPKDLDEFQRIKYTNAEEYSILKAQMRGMSYYNKAVECEPLITSSVKEISKTNNLDMLGLEYRIKTKDSYLGKIRRDYTAGYSGFEINDIIRYTYGADSSSLVEKTLSSIDDLKKMGYNTIRVKNSWLDNSNPYNGINTTVQAPNGQKFEIQYHTPESFELKNNELHKLYEEQRNILDEKSPRYIELEDKMYELSDKLQVPDNIGRVR